TATRALEEAEARREAAEEAREKEPAAGRKHRFRSRPAGLRRDPRARERAREAAGIGRVAPDATSASRAPRGFQEGAGSSGLGSSSSLMKSVRSLYERRAPPTNSIPRSGSGSSP